MNVQCIEIQSDKEDQQPSPISSSKLLSIRNAINTIKNLIKVNNQTSNLSNNNGKELDLNQKNKNLNLQNKSLNVIKKSSKITPNNKNKKSNKSQQKQMNPFTDSIYTNSHLLPQNTNKNNHTKLLKNKILNNRVINYGNKFNSDGQDSSSSQESQQYKGNKQQLKEKEKIQLDKTMIKHNKKLSSKGCINFYISITPLKQQQIYPKAKNITANNQIVIQPLKLAKKISSNEGSFPFLQTSLHANYQQHINNTLKNDMNQNLITQIKGKTLNFTKIVKKDTKISQSNYQKQKINNLSPQINLQASIKLPKYKNDESTNKGKLFKQKQSDQQLKIGTFQSQNVIDYASFVQRRNQKQGQPIDLGALSLDEIVEQCYIKNVVSEEIYVQYINNSSKEKIQKFIKYFIQNNLKAWNFKQLKITIMDHRRLAELLTRLYPKDYILYTPEALNRDIKQFLINLYQLESSDYQKLLDTLDNISKIIFWSTLNIKYQKFRNIPVKIRNYKEKINKQFGLIQDKKLMSNSNNLKRPIQRLYVQLQDSDKELDHQQTDKIPINKVNEMKKPINVAVQRSKKTGKYIKSTNQGKFIPKQYNELSKKKIF